MWKSKRLERSAAVEIPLMVSLVEPLERLELAAASMSDVPEVTTKWFMILRSPTENENGDVSLHHHCNFFHEFRHSRMPLAGIQGPELDPRL
jgi:hypothetical protein